VNLTYPVDALVSFHYYKRDNLMTAVTGPGHLRLIGDSGAFSAYSQGEAIRLPDYAAWCKQWAPKLAWVAALDVIGDAQATWDNWAVFRDRHGIRSIPTLHAGGDLAWLDAYAAEGVDYIGLGGLVGVANRSFGWLVRVLRYARDRHPGMRFHLWGVTTRKILDALPVYSADSSGIMGQAYRYGRLRVFDPATGRDLSIHLNSHDVYKHTGLIRRVYGINPDQVAKSGPANRALLIQMAASTTQQYAAWLQARHHVTPPSWGLAPAAEGTRIHLTGEGSQSPAGDVLRQLGPRVHLADTFAGDFEPLDPAHPDLTGPRVHVTTTSTGGLSRDLAPGPRVHLADTAADNLTAIGPEGNQP
jgi:hypothetical protein